MGDYTKEEALALTWKLTQQYPGKKTALIDKLLNAKTFSIDIEEFNAYDSTMTHNAQIDTEFPKEFEVTPGFSQVANISDVEILRVFEARDDLNEKIASIDEVPTDAEWYKAGLTAEQRISQLRPRYDIKKSEEEGLMEFPGGAPEGASLLTKAISYPTKFVTGALTTGLGAVSQLAGGWYDMFTDFSEEQHETEDFPWIVPAEMYKSGVSGYEDRFGYTPELLEMENILDDLYGEKRVYEEQMLEGGYREAFPGSSTRNEIDALNKIIYDNKLQDPRLLGEI